MSRAIGSGDGMGSVVGIVLGAGSSRRLGRPKQTLPFGDTTLLGWVLRDVERSSLDRVILVVGGAADAALAAVAPARAEVAYNEAYGSGCASSLLAGLDAVGPVDAVALILGDMPGVDAGLINLVRDDWDRHRPWASVTDYEGTPGHPLVFSAAAFPELRALHGDKAVWKLLDSGPERFRRVPADRPLPLDVDTWEDYEAALRALSRR
jgi:molybdenum cofactor cytidylyltransferase